MKIYKTILFILGLIIASHSYAQDQHKNVFFQKIDLNHENIHSIAASEDKLAIKINNQQINIYTLEDDTFMFNQSYLVNNLTQEYGTMKFKNNRLYISIDGYKYYYIEPDNNKLLKTNTFDAEFYIKSSYGPFFENQYWRIEEKGKGKIFIYRKNTPE